MLMDTVKKKLGYMVRSERERRGLSQAKLAEQAGVSTRTISDIETCNGNPELATLIPIAQFLDISIDAAVQDERKEPDTATYTLYGSSFLPQPLLAVERMLSRLFAMPLQELLWLPPL